MREVEFASVFAPETTNKTGPRLQDALMEIPEVKEGEAKKKQVLIFLLNGGLSQFESFDPKPNTDTGGPFRSIPTSVPGTHFSELMPYTAQIADKLAVVRSMFAEKVPGRHGGAREYVVTGRPPQQGPYPWIGPVYSKLLADNEDLPGNIHITPSV